jgi:hypothetical protein
MNILSSTIVGVGIAIFVDVAAGSGVLVGGGVTVKVAV